MQYPVFRLFFHLRYASQAIRKHPRMHAICDKGAPHFFSGFFLSLKELCTSPKSHFFIYYGWVVSQLRSPVIQKYVDQNVLHLSQHASPRV